MMQQQLIQQQMMQQQIEEQQKLQKQKNPKKKTKTKMKNKSIVHLISDINKSLDNYSPSKSSDLEDSEIEPNSDHNEDNDRNIDSDQYVNNNNDKKSKKTRGNNINNIHNISNTIHLVDFIIIVIIFMFISQNGFRIFTGKYIKAVNPLNDGTISQLGLLIYGLIFAILFVLIKKLTY